MRMANPFYLEDPYARTCTAKVQSVFDGKFVSLLPNLFSPRGGGLVSDTGKISKGGEEYKVIAVTKKDGAILHELDRPGLQVGDDVECSLDWERRHKLMRSHTAGHILSAIMFKKSGILITGNAIDVDKSRFDFSMENFDRDAFAALINDANAAISRNLEVSVSHLAREEALKLPGMVKLAGALPPEVKELRIVKIGDVDEQADGGVHVKNTSEIGKIVFLSAENKGKSNRRVYFSLSP